MRILFVSYDLIGADIACRLKQEGHDVKFHIIEKDRRDNLENLVPKTVDWKKELVWVGKGENSLIIFDNVGYGKKQDQLRKKGYSVFGGCELGDKLEENRQFGKEVFGHYGLNTVPLINIDSVQDAINFVKRNPHAWVIKQNGNDGKDFSYVGEFDDGHDIVNVLENFKLRYTDTVITLQQKITGVEIGVGRYFNGHDWVGPIEINIEHKKLYPGDLGSTTGEMGTLAWYDDDEKNKLFQETLAKIKPYLEEVDFRGDFDINCIVNEEGVFPLEATARFGSPIIHLHTEIHQSPWGDFLKAIADGKPYDLKWRKGYGIVVLVTVPPFPYNQKAKGVCWKGINVYFDEEAKKNLEHIHFEEMSVDRHGQYYISGDHGYILYVTEMGKKVKDVMTKTYDLLKHIYIPKMFYRNDIGLKFINEDYVKLKRWGYIKEPKIK